MTMKRIFGVVGLVAALATSSPARADHAEELAAQTLYDKALELMKAGKPASACPLLAESQRLDPAAGTQYHLAECFEKTGRIEAAWKLYTEVAEASKKAGRKDREAQASERAEIVRKQLPRVTITVSPDLATVDGLAVTRDGKPVPREEWSLETPVEAGEHTIEARATGKKPWRGTTVARAGAIAEVRVPALEALAAAVVKAPVQERSLPVDASAAAPPRAVPNKALVIAGASLAAVGLGMGIGFTVKSAAKADERDNLIASDPMRYKYPPCVPGSHTCLPAVHDADAAYVAFARISTVSYIVAGIVGAGTLTYALFPWSPRREELPKASVIAGPGIAAVTLSGAW